MNALEQALYEQLTTSGTTLPGDATGVYVDKGPQAAAPPFVVFSKLSGTWDYTLGKHQAKRTYLYTVRAVCQGHSKKPAADALDACHALLQDAALAVAGAGVMLVQRESDIDYEESVGGETYHHVAGVYRIVVTP